MERSRPVRKFCNPYSTTPGAAVAQEHALGCAVACVASRLGLRYAQALGLFDEPSRAWTVGYYCEDLVRALARGGLCYRFDPFDRLPPDSRCGILAREGTIVFLSPCSTYPAGHYLLRARGGWMNPWINFPLMVPARAGFERALAAPIDWILTEEP